MAIGGFLAEGDFVAWDQAGEFCGHCDVELGGWVGCGVDGAEAVDADVGVALGCLEAGVAEHFGDVADVCSAFEQESGDGVAEEVAASVRSVARVARAISTTAVRRKTQRRAATRARPSHRRSRCTAEYGTSR